MAGKKSLPKNFSPSPAGGRVGNRGFLVQCLVAILEVAEADPPFQSLTMEPLIGNEQFDFTWTAGQRTYATQVKTSQNNFSLPKATQWAQQMQSAQRGQVCTLMLVGTFDTKLGKLNKIGKVKLAKKTLDLKGLRQQAAHLLAEILDRSDFDATTAKQRVRLVRELSATLMELAATSTTLSHEQFLRILAEACPPTPPKVDYRFDFIIELLLGIRADVDNLQATLSNRLNPPPP